MNLGRAGWVKQALLPCNRLLALQSTSNSMARMSSLLGMRSTTLTTEKLLPLFCKTKKTFWCTAGFVAIRKNCRKSCWCRHCALLAHTHTCTHTHAHLRTVCMLGIFHWLYGENGIKEIVTPKLPNYNLGRCFVIGVCTYIPGKSCVGHLFLLKTVFSAGPEPTMNLHVSSCISFHIYLDEKERILL